MGQIECSPQAIENQMKCKYCERECKRNGTRPSGVQMFRCKHCKRCQQAVYRNKAWSYQNLPHELTRHLINGVGVRSTARLLGIAKGTVISGLLRIPSGPQAIENLIPGDTYEVDELRTYAGNKKNEIWIIVAYSRLQRRAVRVVVGPRNRQNIERLLMPLAEGGARRIYTDGFVVYSIVLPAWLHRVTALGTLRVERYHLSLRTHLKRLARRTLCFTRSTGMLRKCVEIYMRCAA